VSRTTDEIVQLVIESGYSLTDNIDEAIFLLDDGRMIDGVYDMGKRGEDHIMIEVAMDIDRYHDGFWDKVHEELRLVRLVAETKFALIKQGQKLTSKQAEILSKTDYRIEEY
jgi:hypothetical protein